MTLKLNSVVLILTVLSVIPFVSCSKSVNLTPVKLRTEYKTDPVVDSQKPRLCWELTAETRGQLQTSFQILVASSPEKLEVGKADLWDSGRVPGNVTNQVEYSGKQLFGLLNDYFNNSFPAMASYFAREKDLSIKDLEQLLEDTKLELSKRNKTE